MPFASKKRQREYGRKYVVEHKEQKCAYDKTYRANNLLKKHIVASVYHRLHRVKINKRSKTWRKDNPERFKSVLRKYHVAKGYPARLKRLYNITIEQYEKALALQGGVCKLCGRPPGKKRLAVDHVHDTDPIKKRVRGLLDFKCNKYLIGRYKAEHAGLFRKAADYLESDFDIRAL